MRQLRQIRRALSLREHLISRKAQHHAPMLAATIDLDGLYEIRSRARKLSPSLMDLKYFHIEYWCAEALRRMLFFGIEKVRKKKILDIGTGFGLFPYACEYFAANVQAIDREGHALYDEITDFLGLRKTHHTVKRRQPLPDLGVRFNLITSYLIAFDRPENEEIWSVEDWRFFIDDVFDNQLNADGTLHLELNYIFPIRNWYSKEVKRLFVERGARIDFDRVTLSKR